MIGETISHYRVVSEIGAGGMGVVYKAEDLRLDAVALKFLPQAVIRESDEKRGSSARRALSALDHPNVCTIYDVEDLPDGRVFLAMAFGDGETLKARLARGPISADRRDAFCGPGGERPRARAPCRHCRSRRQPANIMVTTQGDVKLLDFGIAKLVGSDMTRQAPSSAPIAYMSPEQARGGHVDERSDVWALGVTLYEMLAGRRRSRAPTTSRCCARSPKHPCRRWRSPACRPNWLASWPERSITTPAGVMQTPARWPPHSTRCCITGGSDEPPIRRGSQATRFRAL